MSDNFVTVEQCFLLLVIYSIIGWVYECIVESIRQKRVVNRGFLYGPYCPIYGFGSMIDVIFLGWIDNPVLLFLTAGTVTCSFELLTSFVMEKAFHKRWWDYYDFKFNFDGRICLWGFLAFGALSLLLVNFIHPFMTNLVNTLSPSVFQALTAGLFILIVIDICATVANQLGIVERIKDPDSFNLRISESIRNAIKRISK